MTTPGLPAGAPDPQPDLFALGDDHARARALAAQRPTEPIGPVDGAWLTGHLDACGDCRAAAQNYEADRALLRGLRDRSPQPPRDLWARTSAALDREADRAVRTRRASQPPSPAASHRRRSWSPGIVAGFLVIALVAGSSLLDGLGRSLFPAPTTGASGPAATPITLLADVGWIQSGQNGAYDVYLTQVDQVCPVADPGACGPLQDVARTSIALGVAPRSVSLSPNSGQLVVVASNGGAGGAVYVVPVPAGASRTGTARPSATPLLASAGPGASATPVIAASFAPAGSASPGLGGAGPLPDGGAIAIAEGVIVVGGTAAHSPDGTWFSFAARPADGSTGPDIYVWRVGEARARPITSDHRSIFSGWLGNRILGSRVDETAAGPGASAKAAASGSPAPSNGAPAVPSAPPAIAPSPSPSPIPSSTATPTQDPAGTVPAASPAGSRKPSSSPAPSGVIRPTLRPGFVIATERTVTSFLLDPETGEAQDLPSGRYLRPIVDPTGTWVLYWDGSVVSDAQGVDWLPGTGRLVVAPWNPAAPIDTIPGPSLAAGSPAPSAGSLPSGGLTPASAIPPAASTTPAAVSPSASASPAASTRAAVTSSPSASAAPAPARPQGLVDGPLVDFDAAFDPTGTHLAVWIGDPTDPGTGSLTLFLLEDGAWRADPQHRLVDVPALRGFAIGQGELVWVTPADPTGQGSRIEVAGWTTDGFGSVQSVPGERLIVIR